MKTALIINPASGRIDYPRQIEWLKKRLAQGGFQTREFLTAAPSEAIELSRQAVGEGTELLVTVGGDGTLNEVINGIAGSSAKLGIIPTGLSNVLARELSVPLDPEAALAVIQKGATRRIDLGVANGRYFALMVGVGLDARAVKAVNSTLKRYLKRYAYHLSGLRSIIFSRSPPFRIILDGHKELEGYAAVISNARFYGGPHQITPAARIDDACLDCCLFEKGRRIDYLRYAWGVIRQHHLHYSDVLLEKTRQAEIRESGIPIQIDGDFLGFTPLNVQIRPQFLPVVVPARNE